MKPKPITEESLVPPDWVDKKEGVTVREWGQREYDSGNSTGFHNGLMRASVMVMEHARYLFEMGIDEDAKQWRDMSEKIKKEAKEHLQKNAQKK